MLVKDAYFIGDSWCKLFSTSPIRFCEQRSSGKSGKTSKVFPLKRNSCQAVPPLGRIYPQSVLLVTDMLRMSDWLEQLFEHSPTKEYQRHNMRTCRTVFSNGSNEKEGCQIERNERESVLLVKWRNGFRILQRHVMMIGTSELDDLMKEGLLPLKLPTMGQICAGVIWINYKRHPRWLDSALQIHWQMSFLSYRLGSHSHSFVYNAVYKTICDWLKIETLNSIGNSNERLLLKTSRCQLSSILSALRLVWDVGKKIWNKVSDKSSQWKHHLDNSLDIVKNLAKKSLGIIEEKSPLASKHVK